MHQYLIVLPNNTYVGPFRMKATAEAWVNSSRLWLKANGWKDKDMPYMQIEEIIPPFSTKAFSVIRIGEEQEKV